MVTHRLIPYRELVAHDPRLDDARMSAALGARAAVKTLSGDLLGPGRYERTWTGPPRIAKVLRSLGQSMHWHAQYSWLGSEPLVDARLGKEDRTVELDVGRGQKLVRPAARTLVRPHGDLHDEFTYAWLELANLEPSGVYDDLDGYDFEELTQLKRAEYAPRDCIFSGVDDELGEAKPLPAQARVVTRVFRGQLLIVPSFSVFATCRDYRTGLHGVLGKTRFEELVHNLLTDRRGSSVIDSISAKRHRLFATGAAL